MGKSYKKSARSAKNKNETLNRVVLEEEDVIFGRTTKKLGNGRFMIKTANEKGHGIEVDAYLLGKSIVRIEIGDVVVVGRNDSGKTITYEILGSCERSVVETLRKANRLHPSLFNEEDLLGEDLFDRSEEVKVEDETAIKKDKSNKPVKKDKMTASADDDDVNIDDI
jgi:translation initiation factor IF-1